MPRDRGRRKSVTRRRRYTKDLLDRVIYQRYVLGLETTDISRNLDIPRRVVQRAIQTFDRTGEPCRTEKRTEYHSKLDAEDEDFLTDLVEERPDLFLDEMRDELKAQRHKTVHITTIWRLLKRLGLGLKQVRMSLIHLCTDPLMLAQLSQLAAERDPERRAIFRYIIGLESPDWLVCLDETHVDTRTTYRVNGWGKRGQRVRVSHNWVRGKRWSILPAITRDGILHVQSREDAFDGDAFLEYLENLLSVMKPYPGPRSVLVMDNCRIHHVQGVEAMCAARGVKLLYLPPYSPDFNPIETGFSAFKADGRRYGHAFRAALDHPDPIVTTSYFNLMLQRVFTPANTRAWFKKSGYF